MAGIFLLATASGLAGTRVGPAARARQFRELRPRHRPQPSGRPQWAYQAARLSGESEAVRRHALRRLRLINDLNPQLVAALRTPNRGLALDAIAALDLQALLPVLIADSVHDGDGQIHLTLDALISPWTRDELNELFRAQISPAEIPSRSAASLIAILDGLDLMAERLPVDTLSLLLGNSSYEVRIAAVLYARQLTRKLGTREYLPVLRAASRGSPRELRAEAVRAIESLTSKPLAPGGDREKSRAASGEVDEAGTAAPVEAMDPDAVDHDVMDDGQGEVGRGVPDLFSQTEASLLKLDTAGGARRGCRSDYRRFFRRGKADIRIVLGYKDARPARFVGDRYERAALVEHLVRPCPGQYQACGFSRDRDSAELLHRTIAGPDGFPVQVDLRVADSSWSSDDDLNRRSPDQRIKTARTRRTFFGGLAKADAVLYLGHSRDGGGPDFGPPRIRSWDKHVDYAWYHVHRLGWRAMVRALRASARTPRLLALFSCFASRHFASGLRRDFPTMGLITSPSWAYTDDELAQALATLDSLLGMRCRARFEAALGREGGMRIRGFFNRSSEDGRRQEASG